MKQKKSILCLTLCLIALAPSAPAKDKPQPLGVAIFEIYRPDEVFRATIDGSVDESYLPKSQCVYYEMSYGDKKDDAWTIHWTSRQTKTAVTLSTKKGRFQLPINRLRPYLKPTRSRVYTLATAKHAPQAVREELNQQDRPITVEEYCLARGGVYFARVDIERYNLPPASESDAPGEGHNDVIVLSDEPFVAGKPKSSVTPAFLGWSY